MCYYPPALPEQIRDSVYDVGDSKPKAHRKRCICLVVGVASLRDNGVTNQKATGKTNLRLKPMSKTEYIKTFHGYQIYKIPEAYQMTNGQLTDRYIAIQPTKHYSIEGVDLPDLEADILESER